MSKPKFNDGYFYELEFSASRERSYLACLFHHLGGNPRTIFMGKGAVPKKDWLDNLEALKFGIVIEWEFPETFRILCGLYPILNQVSYQFETVHGKTIVKSQFAVTPMDLLSRALTAYMRRQMRKSSHPPESMVDQLHQMKLLAENPDCELGEMFREFQQVMVSESKLPMHILPDDIPQIISTTISGAIVVAMADGRISAAEKNLLVGLVYRSMGSQVRTSEVFAILQKHVDLITQLSSENRRDLIGTSRALTNEGKSMVLSGIAKVAIADGRLSPDVHQTFHSVKNELRFNDDAYREWTGKEISMVTQAVGDGEAEKHNITLIKKLSRPPL